MTTSQTSFLSEILGDQPIPVGKLAYFRERLRNRLYDIIVNAFRDQENAGILTRADFARRIGKRPEQITHYLGSPGNWTLDTVSDLLLAMRLELKPTLVAVSDGPQRNFSLPDWMAVETATPKTRTDPLRAIGVTDQTTTGGLTTVTWAAAE